MSLFVFMGRRREIVEVPEKKADGSPLDRGRKGALHMGPGTVELTGDEEKYLQEKRPEIWKLLEKRVVPKKAKPEPAPEPESEPASESEDPPVAASPEPETAAPTPDKSTGRTETAGSRSRRGGRGRG